MSITGTVLVIDGVVKIFPPKALEDEFFNAFAEGGKVSVCKCEGARCLAVTEQERQIRPEDNHAARVRDMLDKIEDKIYTEN